MTLLSYLKEGSVKPHHVAVGAPWAQSEAFGDDGGSPPFARAVEFTDGGSPVDRVHAAAHVAVMARVHQELVAEMDPEVMTGTGQQVDYDLLRRDVEEGAEARLAEADPTIPRPERRRMATQIADEVLGFGPLAPLLRDPTITEIVVNGYDQVYYERAGRLHPADVSFRDDAHVLQIVDRMLWPIGRRIDYASPMVDARLPDGSRMNAIIPPLSVFGPAVTIRKFSRQFLHAEDLVSHGTLSESAVTFLAACVRSRLNILVSGGTGSGKTTLLNILSNYVPAHERIITIEDPAELQITHRDRVCLETRPPNIEGKGAVVQRDLLKNALRMRPDRIIVGECRGAESFDMLQAMNTGHDGSLTTVHANSPRDALARIQNMVLMAVDLPIQAIREQIVSGIQLVIHLARQADGSRKVTQISEILPSHETVVTMQDLFTLQRNEQGTLELLPTGMQPHALHRLTIAGQQLAADFFATMQSPSAGPGAPARE
jgi:pilus assembly protein CpaF